MFKSDRGWRESLIWMRYAPTMADVHAIGCKKQRDDREEGKRSTYVGAMRATVGGIKDLRSKNGVGFNIIQDTSNGQGEHHAHIFFDGHGVDPTKNDKNELKLILKKSFSALHEHRCPEDPQP